MSTQIAGGNGTPNLANVDASFNLKVNTPTTEAPAGFVAVTAENDAGDVTTTRWMQALEITDDFRARVGIDTMVFSETFPGVAFNTALWNQVVTTMTATVASGFANLNAGLSTASGAVARLQTYRTFPIYKTYTTYAEMEVQFSQAPQSNQVSEWGLLLATGTTAPTDGVFFRLTAAGEFRCVINYNGTETTSAALNFSTLIGVATTQQFLIYAGSTIARFWINNVLVAEIPNPAGQGSLTSSMALPLAFRTYNTAVTATAQVMRIGNTNVTFADQASNKPWPHVLCGAGATAFQGQDGMTMGSTQTYVNNTNPTAAVPTNTTAALGSGLGGQFWETDTLAVNTDGIISSYQVPLATSTVPGKTLYVTHVFVHSFVQTALTGGGYVAQWCVAFGHTSVSLVTGEGAGTKAPRRISLGLQAVASGALAGVLLGDPMVIDLSAAPVPVYQGEFIQTVKKKIGTAPSAGVIAHIVRFAGYWE